MEPIKLNMMTSQLQTQVDEKSKDGINLLSVVNTLFNRNKTGDGNKDICPATGLPTSNALIYSLQTCILHKNDKLVLVMCDIDHLRALNDEIGYAGANFKIEDVGKIIKKFVSLKPFEMQAFRNTKDGKGDLFAVLLHCRKKLEFAERHMKRLSQKIKKFTNTTVSIGMTNINKFDTVDTWIERAVLSMNIVKENGGNGVNFLKIDFNHSKQKNDAKHKNKNTNSNVTLLGKERKLGTKEAFDSKIEEIARKDDNKWIIALLDCDNLGDLKEKKGKSAASSVVEQVKNEILELCDIMGDNCFGYQCGGDEFGLIVFDNGGDNNYLSGKLVVNTLIENVGFNCSVTISAGFSRLNVSKHELVDEWYDRTNDYLKQAKTNGKNQAYWGQSLRKLEKLNIIDNKEDEAIFVKRLKEIQVNPVFCNSNNRNEQSLRFSLFFFLFAICLLFFIFLFYFYFLLFFAFCFVLFCFVLLCGWWQNKEPKTQSQTLAAQNERMDLVDLNHKLLLDDIKDSQYEAEIESTGLVSDLFSFNQLYKAIARFDIINQHLSWSYAWHENTSEVQNRMCNIPKCHNKLKNEFKDVLICENHRRRIGDLLYKQCKERDCLTSQIKEIVINNLMCNNAMLIDRSKEYKLKSNYFSNVYAYLTLEREIVSQLLSNLLQEKNSEKFEIFDFIFLAHVYLEHVCRLLVLLYGCFNDNYICIFYSWIEIALGTLNCKKIMTNKKDDSMNDESIDSKSVGVIVYGLALGEIEFNASMTRKKSEMENAIQSTSILNEIIYDIYDYGDYNGNNETDSHDGSMTNPLNFVSKISSELSQLVNNIKSENVARRIASRVSNADTIRTVPDPQSHDIIAERIRMEERNRINFYQILQSYPYIVDNSTIESILGICYKLIVDYESNNTRHFKYTLDLTQKHLMYRLNRQQGVSKSFLALLGYKSDEAKSKMTIELTPPTAHNADVDVNQDDLIESKETNEKQNGVAVVGIPISTVYTAINALIKYRYSQIESKHTQMAKMSKYRSDIELMKPKGNANDKPVTLFQILITLHTTYNMLILNVFSNKQQTYKRNL